jgi:hypothetical protein
MFEPLAAYVVAISAAVFSGLAALALIRMFNHFDPPEDQKKSTS